MTAEQIRSIAETVKHAPDCDHTQNGIVAYSSSQFVVLREIAAQLAEQNQQISADSEFRRNLAEEQRQNQKKHDDLLAQSAAGIEAFRANLSPPPQPPRVEFPGTVTHLGCIILEPDGAYKIATNQGQLIELEAADVTRILGLVKAPDQEAKPS